MGKTSKNCYWEIEKCNVERTKAIEIQREGQFVIRKKLDFSICEDDKEEEDREQKATIDVIPREDKENEDENMMYLLSSDEDEPHEQKPKEEKSKKMVKKSSKRKLSIESKKQVAPPVKKFKKIKDAPPRPPAASRKPMKRIKKVRRASVQPDSSSTQRKPVTAKLQDRLSKRLSNEPTNFKRTNYSQDISFNNDSDSSEDYAMTTIQKETPLRPDRPSAQKEDKMVGEYRKLLGDI